MDLTEITNVNPEIANPAIRELKRRERHQAYHLRVIASLLADSHREAAYRLAEDMGIDITPSAATDRILRRFGNAEEQRESSERLRQRFESAKQNRQSKGRETVNQSG